MGVTVKINIDRLLAAQGELSVMLNQSFADCIDDLVRTSSETTPIDKGILQKSHTKEINRTGDIIEGTVEFAVREKAFNYALQMHEGTYNLGVHSLAKPGGTGMSGKHYMVGRKYLTRVLEGEVGAYQKHIETALQKPLVT